MKNNTPEQVSQLTATTLGDDVKNLVGVVPTEGDDLLIGDDNDDNIEALGGNDTIDAGLGRNNSVDGGDGDDLLIIDYSSGSYMSAFPPTGISSYLYYIGGVWYGSISAYNTVINNYDSVNFRSIDRFQITGTSVDDLIVTWDGNDTIHGGQGDDTINNNYGVDIIDGGEGIDVLDFADFSALTTAFTIDETGATIKFANGAIISNVEYFKNLTTGSGNDSIYFSESFNNIINAGIGDDTINPGVGYDQVDGGAGNDLLIIDYSKNTSSDSEYTPGIYSSISNNETGSFDGYVGGLNRADIVVFSNIERFKIIGTIADDTIITGSGDDELYGADGNDNITGGGGQDYIEGGIGNDTIYGGDGNDEFYGDDGDDEIYGGAGDDWLEGGEGQNYIEGGAGDDTIYGGSGNDEFYGDAGNDSIDGGAGDDWLDGGAGNDTLVGGAGDDTLIGGLGLDNLSGGAGVDRFVLSKNTGLGAISDFLAGTDKLEVSASAFGGGLSGATLTAAQFAASASVGASSVASANTRFLYNTSNGALYFDLDGGTGTNRVQIAALTNLASLNANSFSVVA
jgi:Ca2+-binding RTX toxin-like protein